MTTIDIARPQGSPVNPPFPAEFADVLDADSFHGVIGAAEAAILMQRTGYTLPQLAASLVPFAQGYAVVPVSNFNVGAIGLGTSGALYYGANYEVSGQALSFTVHAEQACVANAWVNGENGLQLLSISAAPCGYCRQFLYELVDAATLQIGLPGQPPRLLTSFLPDPFGPGDLGIQGGLMQPQANGLVLPGPIDTTTEAALAAANASYSPYTATYAGVALTTSDGITCVGHYAENAAYNPSMSPLEGALSQLAFYNRSPANVVEAVLVEAPGTASQAGATNTLWSTVSGIALTVLVAETS
ncbi:cytidine deaminase [Sphingomonas endolithica]|uniref:cytidine deaminase n=1 Tax=Sphingomonas endolithica TaxID=2972485 RepID=UPI0021AFA731|nr:cytidine deaminase [Sphingomonas sp. ZFBP2030]